MTRLTIPLILTLALLVAACAPVAESTLSRSGTEVTATVTATEPLYDVTLSLANTRTADERCVALEGNYAACVLGDLLPGETITVRGESPADASCVAFGFTRVAHLESYRPLPCRVRQ